MRSTVLSSKARPTICIVLDLWKPTMLGCTPFNRSTCSNARSRREEATANVPRLRDRASCRIADARQRPHQHQQFLAEQLETEITTHGNGAHTIPHTLSPLQPRPFVKMS
jgi:hypothetical protein